MLKHVHCVKLNTFSETHFMKFNEEIILKFTLKNSPYIILTILTFTHLISWEDCIIHKRTHTHTLYTAIKEKICWNFKTKIWRLFLKLWNYGTHWGLLLQEVEKHFFFFPKKVQYTGHFRNQLKYICVCVSSFSWFITLPENKLNFEKLLQDKN